MNIAAVLHRLETEQRNAAKEAMERPGGRGEFDYGRAVGFYAGLQHAKDTITVLYEETEARKGRL